MSILYNFRKMPPRPDQNEPEEAEGRLFAQAIIQRQYTTEDLCRDISDRSSFSSGDITGLMIAMEELIFEYLASGYSFRLGNMGELFPFQKPLVRCLPLALYHPLYKQV